MSLRRREFIAGLCGAAAWPLTAGAQQDGQARRVAVLASGDLYIAIVRAVLQELRELGWIEGRNLRLDVRFGDSDIKRTSAFAAELVKLAPDAIFAAGGVAVDAVQQETRTIPIIAELGDFNERGTVKKCCASREKHYRFRDLWHAWRQVARTAQGSGPKYHARRLSDSGGKSGRRFL
jgi:putative ABC transport system substrate-binding protein